MCTFYLLYCLLSLIYSRSNTMLMVLTGSSFLTFKRYLSPLNLVSEGLFQLIDMGIYLLYYCSNLFWMKGKTIWGLAYLENKILLNLALVFTTLKGSLQLAWFEHLLYFYRIYKYLPYRGISHINRIAYNTG